MAVEYRSAKSEDLESLTAFVDFWLTGGGQAAGIPGAGHDFFVPKGRHEAYLKKYSVLLATFEGEIVGWAVKTKKGVLIHLLVAATFRARGIGSELLKRMSPEVVRSKFDQSTGDPAGFYRKHGFVKESSERVGKKKNIDVFIRGCDVKKRSDLDLNEVGDGVVGRVDGKIGVCANRQRTIDVLAKRLQLRVFPSSDDYC